MRWLSQSYLSALLLSWTVVIAGISTKAQSKTFTDYYFEAKALTDRLKTYQILVEARGESFPFIANDVTKNEIGKSFQFLNTKKLADHQPDFVIKIVLSYIAGDADYVYKGRDNDREVYNIRMAYDLSFMLVFEAPGKDTLRIPLCTEKHYETKATYYYQVSIGSPKPTGVKDVLDYQVLPTNQNKPIDQYIQDVKKQLLEKATFIGHFNELLAAFRKKK